jgi:hypothetical protein
MATRSTIALEFADGTVQQIYAHFDGYLEHNGRILKEHYSDPFKLQELIELGSISVLAPEIGVKHPFDNPHRWGTPDYLAHEAEYKHMTKFYGRDRGETETKARRFADFADYQANGQWEEYNYILRQVDGQAQWFVNGMTFEELATEEAEDE